MNFDFSDDQVQLQDAVRRWVDKSYPFTHYRATVQAGGFARANYKQLADLGLCGLLVAEEHGGLAMGAVEAMLVLQELGAGLVLEPLTDTFMVGSVLAHFASPQQQAQWLPGIASGDTLAVLAWQERGARYRHTSCRATATATTTVTAAGGGYLLNAAKSIVPAGDQADAFLVPALLDGTLALFWLQRNAAGVQTRGYGTQDGSRAADVMLTNAAATLITTEGVAALELALDVGLAGACAQGVGVMDKTLALTADYLNTRKQFGVAIGTFQALRHRIADMKMQLE
ncbi:MAG: acyl-CoA/acyl-ACP dehydrogenase, partial [Rhodoferax sp.]|nr:acyl-CoA/acyl-ACP dehydrogenase [Rhodoferax sp.]